MDTDVLYYGDNLDALRRYQPLIASGVLAMVTMAACSPFAGPRLQYPADPPSSTWLAASDMEYGQPLSVGSIMLCVSSASTASISSVTIADSRGDIELKAFAVRPNPMPSGVGLGTAKVELAGYASGFAPANPQEVTGVCPKDVLAPTTEEAAGESELGVEMRLVSGDIGGGSALDIRYAIGDEAERLLTVPFGIWLCASTCPDNIGEPTGAAANSTDAQLLAFEDTWR